MVLSESIQAAADLISYWHLEGGTKLILDSVPLEQDRYLEAVDQILQSAQCDELKDVIFMAVARLKLEFKTTLFSQTGSCHLGVFTKLRGESLMGSGAFHESSSSMTDNSSYGDYTVYGFSQEDDLPVQYLRKIAERLDSCGHLVDCTLIYSEVRKPFVDASMKELKAVDVKRLVAEELKMISNNWIQAAKVYTKLLFVQEKKMAELIFGGFGNSIAEEAFMLTVEDAVVNLFSFVDIISSSYQSSERIHIILSLYDALLSLAPVMNALFPYECIENRLTGILTGLQHEVRRMLLEFEDALFNEKSKILYEAAVHPLTKYVMMYIDLLLYERELLTSLIVSSPSMTVGSLKYPDVELQDPGSLSPLSLHIVLIIALLQLNLEAKSKKCEKGSFSYLFMVNNIRFIILSIKRSKDLKEVVGTDYLNKLTKNLEHAIYGFQRLMLRCLNEEHMYFSLCFYHGVSTSALRKNVKTFNNLCEDVHVFRSSLELADSNLSEELCESTIEKLLPIYEGFLKKFRGHLKSGKTRNLSVLSFPKISINYTVEELKTLFSRELCPSTIK